MLEKMKKFEIESSIVNQIQLYGRMAAEVNMLSIGLFENILPLYHFPAGECM
jgi:hypothetical protein